MFKLINLPQFIPPILIHPFIAHTPSVLTNPIILLYLCALNVLMVLFTHVFEPDSKFAMFFILHPGPTHGLLILLIHNPFSMSLIVHKLASIYTAIAP